MGLKIKIQALKPALPKGTRDFLPGEIKKRNYLFNIIREKFALYGYDAIETPAMEALETLAGNYGEEGDKLLFKVLNNGDFLKDVEDSFLTDKDSFGIIRHISKRGLRYDLTVPFARYIVMNRQHIKFPFKRSAIQPVWRADKPQKGRYQEFYQCDADVAGSNSLYYEAELIRLYDDVFTALNLPVNIRWNNRKILFGISQTVGLSEHFHEVTVIIDKLDKIGKEGIERELIGKGFPVQSIRDLLKLIALTNLEELEEHMNSETGTLGIVEMREVLGHLSEAPLENHLQFDATLARGLGYYTGCIFEVSALNANMGSIGGGGRYDNLTANFGLKDVSGVGISFGIERIYDVMEEKKLFPDQISRSKQVLIVCLDNESFGYAVGVTNQLRVQGVSAELYPVVAKLQKQMSYANDLDFAFVCLIGEAERTAGKISLKNMMTGVQDIFSFHEVVARIGQ